jgi:hypothetical protein
MPMTQTGWPSRAALAILLTAGTWAAFGNVCAAQDREVYREDHRQVIYTGNNQGYYAPACHFGCYGGPYKGFYPCNGKTPYCGGACSVYGDAPIYTAPADYGHHCAARCP